MAASISSLVVEPDEYSSWNDSASPLVMPAPHSVALVPGLRQVDVPPGVTFQPCALSRLMALDGLYG